MKLIILTLIGSSIIATATCDVNLEEKNKYKFNCPMLDNNYIIKQEDSDFVYGDVVAPMELKSNADLDLLIKTIDEARKEVYQNNIVNDVDIYEKYFNKHMEVGGNEEAEFKLFREYNEENRGDQLTLMMKILEEVSSKPNMEQAKDHYYFASSGIPEEMATFQANKIDENKAPSVYDFDKYSLVGIIKFKLNGKLGYAIIDGIHPTNKTPYVMVSEDELSLNEVDYANYEKLITSDGNPQSYSLVGKDQAFIKNIKYILEFNKGRKRATYNYYENENYYTYVDKPLCSFVHDMNVIMASRLRRTLVKYDDDFLVKAYVYTFFEEEVEEEEDEEEDEEERYLFSIGYATREQDGSQSKNLSQNALLKSVKDLSNEENRNILEHVAKIMGTSMENLKQKMTAMENIADIQRKSVVEAREEYERNIERSLRELEEE